MQWTIEYRKCNYCGKEENCRHDVFGFRFYGWGQMNMQKTFRCTNDVPTQIDICPDCMKTRVMPDIKSDFELAHGKKTIKIGEIETGLSVDEIAKTVKDNGPLKEWVIVFDSEIAGPDMYWSDCYKELVTDLDRATVFTETEATDALNRIRNRGVKAIGLNSPRPQRIVCKDKKCACDGVAGRPNIDL